MCEAPDQSKRYIIDCDPGVDDAIALLMCFASLDAADEILAITATHGNVPLKQVLKNIERTLDVCESFGTTHQSKARKVPVYAGCSCPLVKSAMEYTPWHGEDGLGDAFGDADVLPRHVQPGHAANTLVSLCKEYEGEVTLICLGPLTNVALACRLDESFAPAVKELVWMGGCSSARGNVTATSEFNAHKDPEAAHIVLSTFPRCTMVSWEVTVKHAVPWVIFDEFLEQCEASANPRGRFIKAISSPFLRDRERWEGAPICDAVAVAVALDRSIITESFVRFVDVELGGSHTRGMTVVDWSQTGQKKPNVEIVDTIDSDKFHDLLLSILD